MTDYYVDLNGNVTTKKKKKEEEKESKTKYSYSVDLNGNVTKNAVTESEPSGTSEKTAWYEGWFRKGAFEDGYQFGDVTKTILGTGKDATENALTGAIGMVEKTVDAGAYALGGIGGLLGADEFKSKMQNFIQKDLIDEKSAAQNAGITGIASLLASREPENKTDDYSVLGDKTDSVLQSAGQLGGTVMLQAAGVPWFLTTGVTSFGGQTEAAFNEGATYGKAGVSGLITAGAEILTEKLSGGIKFGGKTLDDVLLQPFVDKISNKTVNALVNLGLDAVGEGAEEVISSALSNLGTALYKEESIDELLTSEKAVDEYIESFIGGALLGGGANVGKAVNSISTGRNYKTGLTENEQKVIDKEVENCVSEKEADGTKLSQKEKSAIEEQVKSDLAKGYIGTDTIESVLGGKTYESYKAVTEQEAALKKEIESLENLPATKITVKQSERLAEARKQLSELDTTTSKEQLGREVSALAKKDRLGESYNEKTRRSQAFTADLTKYNTKQQEVVKKAAESGILNNTNRTHEFVDMIAKIAADKGVSFDFTNNQKLKDSGFALEGKTVNGFVKDGNISLNIDSVKYLNAVVGHEITHVLEGTELYGELQQAVKTFAESKGEYGKRLEALQKLYEGVEGANIENELTADLIGDYLFTDSDFVSRLSTEKPGLFKRIFEEIKYLVKTATVGSKQARELEKVKRAFEKAYKDAKVRMDGATKYSIVEPFTDSTGKKFKEAVLLDTDFFDGISPRNWGEKLKELVESRSANNPVIMLITDENGEPAVLQFAKPNERVTKDGKSNHKVIDKLWSTSDNMSKLAVVHIDEVITASEENLPYHTEENNHQWLDENGWLHRNANVINQKNGNIYNLKIDIAKTADGRNILYATDGKINRVGNVNVNSLKIKGSWQNSNSGTIVAEEEGKVKYSVSDSSGRQLSEGQREYFKDSKVRDENGALLTVYHGTDAKFTTFRSDKKRTSGRLNFGKGFYFSPSKSIAENYTETGNVMSVYVNLKKPYEIYGTQFDASDLDRISAELGEKVTIDNVSQVLQKHGYDGIIARKYNGTTNPVGQVIAFESNQIKSTENLTPTEEEDINLSLSETSFDIAPPIRNNVYGKDIALDLPIRKDLRQTEEIAPVQQSVPIMEDIGPVVQAAEKTMEDIGPVRDDIEKKAVPNAEENASMEQAYSPDELPTWEDVKKPEADTYAPEPESYPKKKVTTVKERNAAKLQSLKVQLRNEQDLMEKAHASYNAEIRDLRSLYDSKKNKNTRTAQELLDRIERRKNSRDNTDAYYEKRINDIKTKIGKMNTKEFKIVEQRQSKEEEYQTMFGNLIGDTSTWIDKKMGIYYKVNTLRRNLRDIVRDENGNRDIAKADAIYDELQGKYNHNEAKLNREANEIRAKYAEKMITAEEDAYIQMLGEYRHNPDTTLTADVMKEYYEKHKAKIDTNKVDEIIASARQLYDELFRRVNATLEEQGMRPIEYREGYFPHFTDDKQSWLAKLLNWKTRKDEIPTDIAGLTEQFKPVRSWQSFDKHRTGDSTDYSFKKGLDMYVQGALDWIYHIEDIQKRRAFENEIRYRHSDQGVKDKVEAIRNNPEYDASEVQDQIDLIYKEARNPLNNFISDFRTQTNTLAGKKSSMDRGTEEWTNRKFYSTMSNISNRVTANMVGGSISSALTNFIPITQSWGEVSPLSSLRAMGDTIRAAVRNDGVVMKSDFLTNRLQKSKKLHQSGWDVISDKVGILMEVVDNFTSQTVWRSKYLENMKAGMSENAAIKNADQFAENVMAGRSRGNNPTIFDAKNPIIKMVTAFQLEVNNQYGYLFKDMPQELQNETKGKLVAGYAKVFVGAYVYNMLYSQLTGRDAAFDPIGIVMDVLKDLGIGGDDEEEEPIDAMVNLTESVLEEVPFIGGLLGGGRIPISSALPYSDSDGVVDAVKNIMQDIADEDWKSIANELSNPAAYLLPPVGGGQIRKTIQGLQMFDDDLPIAGSYTNSGNLRFSVEDTPLNKLQAALFGQWSSQNAREYIEEGRSPLGEKQIQELVDTDLTMADYWKYRDGLKEYSTVGEKIDYIANLDLPIATKNILANNVTDRKPVIIENHTDGTVSIERISNKTPLDLSNYNEFADYDEFDYAVKNPEMYQFLKENNVSYTDYSAFDDDTKDAYKWAYNNPAKYKVAKVIADDVAEYRSYIGDINDISADKDENGKSISGTKKAKVIDYIGKLDIDYGQKLILLRSQYTSDDTYNYDIVEYLNSRADISYEEMKSILEELGMTVLSDGRIIW